MVIYVNRIIYPEHLIIHHNIYVVKRTRKKQLAYLITNLQDTYENDYLHIFFLEMKNY